MTTLRERPAPTGGLSGRDRRWLLLAGAALCAVLLVWIIGFSSVLGVSTVTVRGNSLLSAQQLRAVAAVKRGTPLVRLDTGAVRERIQSLPAIRSATVTTSYPSSVTITVVERVGVGYRSGPSGISIVDDTDVAFRRVAAPPRGLPQLVGSGDDAAEQAVATVAGALSPTVAGLVARISASTPESVTLALTDGRSVLWGGTDRNSDKARLLGVLVKQPGTYFDISDPGTVISRGGN